MKGRVEELRWVYTEYRRGDSARRVTAAKAGIVVFTNTCCRRVSPIYVPPLSQNKNKNSHGIGKYFIIHQTKKESTKICICEDFDFLNVIEMLLQNGNSMARFSENHPAPSPQM